jgi:hypothetical protein
MLYPEPPTEEEIRSQESGDRSQKDGCAVSQGINLSSKGIQTGDAHIRDQQKISR